MPRPRSGGASLVIRRSGRASAQGRADDLCERLILSAAGREADQLTGARVEGRLTRSDEHVVATGVAEVPEDPRLDHPGRARRGRWPKAATGNAGRSLSASQRHCSRPAVVAVPLVRNKGRPHGRPSHRCGVLAEGRDDSGADVDVDRRGSSQAEHLERDEVEGRSIERENPSQLARVDR